MGRIGTVPWWYYCAQFMLNHELSTVSDTIPVNDDVLQNATLHGSLFTQCGNTNTANTANAYQWG